MIYKLYKNGNVNYDIEQEDRIVPYNFNHTVTEAYSSNNNIGIKNNMDKFIEAPVFSDIKAPWNL